MVSINQRDKGTVVLTRSVMAVVGQLDAVVSINTER